RPHGAPRLRFARGLRVEPWPLREGAVTRAARRPKASPGEHVLGVISDTHGLLRPEALEALAGVERIVHAGARWRPPRVDPLPESAPVVAVRGNNDTGPWARRLPLTETITFGGARILVLHDVKELAVDPAAAGVAAVIAGHSHRPSSEERDGVLFFNPGSAG